MVDSVSQDPEAPSGAQYELRFGDQRAVVTEVGAGLREYHQGDRAVLDGYPVAEMCSGGRGQTLIPWPNRVDGGRYRFDPDPDRDTDGDPELVPELRLALTEPSLGNAIHGLTRWVNWAPTRRESTGEAASLTMELVLHGQPGWPFVLACALEYTLDGGGLTVRTRVRNTGATACPYGTGAHPYLTVGTELVDEVTVHAPGARYYPVDERGIPEPARPVAGTEVDLTRPVTLGPRVLDTAYTELTRDPDGLARTRLTGPDGRVVVLWQDTAYAYRQVFTGDTLPAHRKRRGLAVEPMTAAPNALRTGEGLIVLPPGGHHEASWGIGAG